MNSTHEAPGAVKPRDRKRMAGPEAGREGWMGTECEFGKMRKFWKWTWYWLYSNAVNLMPPSSRLKKWLRW